MSESKHPVDQYFENIELKLNPACDIIMKSAIEILEACPSAYSGPI